MHTTSLHLQRTYRGGGAGTTEKSVVVGVVSRIDLLKYITTHAPDGSLLNSPSALTPMAGASSSAGSGSSIHRAKSSGSFPAPHLAVCPVTGAGATALNGSAH